MTDLRAQLQATLGSAYTLERELGGGGMSHVFLALETALGRRVVVKVLLPELGAAVSAERFRREILLAAQLQHPHIVPLLSAGESSGLPYYTMPFIEGESLRARLGRSGELPIAEALRVLREVASALAYAHEHGVAHRDIKPDNVLISGGSAMVTDFGVAKALSASAMSGNALTSLGVALGTPAYMAPEQAAADPTTDHRADVYAFGAVAYELLTGQTPFIGRTSQAQLAAHMTEVPEPVERRRRGVPPPLARLVMRCLEKRPADRPQTAAEIVQALDAIVTPSGGTTPTGQVPAWVGRRARWMVPVAVAVIVVAVGGLALARWTRSSARSGPAANSGPTRSVAVLPLVNVGGGAEDEYFSDGMTDELTSALAKVPGLRVASRTSAFAFKGRRATDVREIGRALNVGAVLEGTVRRSGQRLRVAAQLTNVADGLALWSETYEHELKDVFAVQDDIARAIVGALQVQLGGAAAAGAPRRPLNLEAHDLFLRGRFYFYRFTEADLRRSLDLYQRALALDSGFAPAWAGIADVWNWLADDWVAPKEAYPRAKAAAQRAIALDSTLGEAHAALGAALMWYDWDYAGAEREYQQAVALNPNSADAHAYYGTLLSGLERHDSAAAQGFRAQSLDPLTPFRLRTVALVYQLARQYAKALDVCRQALVIDSTYSAAYICLGDNLLSAGRPVEALRAYARASEIGAWQRRGLARAYAALGRRGEALRIAAELERESRRRYVRPEAIAAIYAAVGDRDAAFRWLEKAYDARSAGMLTLNVANAWDPIRNDSRFVALVQRVGLPERGLR